jgi:hypothetical protein
MLKLFVVSLGVLATLNSFAVEDGKILVREKVINLGKIMGDEITPVNSELRLVRDDKSPNHVTIKFDYHKFKKSCIEYEVRSKTKKEIKVNSCEELASDSSKKLFNCSVKTFEAFDILKRVCSKKGLILKKASKKIRVLFMRSVALAPGATEEFSISLNQKKMNSSKVKVSGKVENSSSLYKVNSLFNSVLEFKAK